MLHVSELIEDHFEQDSVNISPFWVQVSIVGISCYVTKKHDPM